MKKPLPGKIRAGAWFYRSVYGVADLPCGESVLQFNIVGFSYRVTLRQNTVLRYATTPKASRYLSDYLGNRSILVIEPDAEEPVLSVANTYA